jgi:hypothetical protein
MGHLRLTVLPGSAGPTSWPFRARAAGPLSLPRTTALMVRQHRHARQNDSMTASTDRLPSGWNCRFGLASGMYRGAKGNAWTFPPLGNPVHIPGVVLQHGSRERRSSVRNPRCECGSMLRSARGSWLAVKAVRSSPTFSDTGVVSGLTWVVIENRVACQPRFANGGDACNCPYPPDWSRALRTYRPG